MEFSQRPKRRRARTVENVLSAEDELKRCYPHPLQLYDIPPTDDVSLEEFGKFAVDRYEVLSRVAAAKASHGRDDAKLREALRDVTSKRLPLNVRAIKKEDTDSGRRISIHESSDDKDRQSKLLLEERRKDHISHFILRLAFSRTEELRRWFVDNELELFRYRFEMTNSSPESMRAFLDSAKMDYEEMTQEEKKSMSQDLRESTSARFEDLASTPFYKVPFCQALDLVSRRRVFLSKGIAHVPHADFISIVLGELRARLQRALLVAARALPRVEGDGRILPVLKSISSMYTGDDYSKATDGATGKIHPGQLNELSRISYPICMRHLHETVRERHHLKHGGRLQYGLFIKGIGLTLQEALHFWQTEFTRIMDLERFSKSYAYSVRHSYGREGRRKSYTPYSCIKIITSNAPGPEDSHGCPFKHWDPDVLAPRLRKYGVAQSAINEILSLVRDHHYQIACSRYFEATHNVPADSVSINHPNEYFQRSREYYNNGKKPPASFSRPTTAAPPTVKTEPAENDEMSEADMSSVMEMMDSIDG